MRRNQRIVAVILTAAVICAGLLILRYGAKPKSTLADTANLPEFIVTDRLGRLVNSGSLRGEPIVVLFVRPSDENNLRLMNDVLVNWMDKAVHILIISGRFTTLRLPADEDRQYQRIHIVEDEKGLAALFDSRGYGDHFLFDADGKLVFSAKNSISYSDGIKPFLKETVDRDRFAFSQLVTVGEALPEFGSDGPIGRWFRATPKRYYIIGLLSRFCESCRSGAILRWLEEIYKKYSPHVGILCLLPERIDGADFDELISQAGISFPVVRGQGELAESWAASVRRYGGIDNSDIFFICDREGRVLDGGTIHCKECFSRIAGLIKEASVQNRISDE